MIKYNNQKERRDSFPILKYVTFTIAALILLLFYLWQQTENEVLKIRIEKLKIKKSNLLNINQHFQLKLEQMIKLNNIEKIAVEELDMKYPKKRRETPAITVPEKEKNINLKSAKSY